MFILEDDMELASRRAREELLRRHWVFISYTERSTLIEERVRQQGGAVWDAYAKAESGDTFFRVFPNAFGASSGMKPLLPARVSEHFLDSVIEDAGGRRLTKDEFPENARNADYLIEDVIIELKDLQEEGLEKANHQGRIAKLFAPHFVGAKEIVVDPTVLDSQEYLAYLDILSRPIKTQIRSASEQIKSTKKFLERPANRGGLIFLNTGFGSFPHDEFARQVQRFASKDSKQFDLIIAISVWQESNGFDTVVYYEFHPVESKCNITNRIASAFDKRFEELMTDMILKPSRSEQLATPTEPIAFANEALDFSWEPPVIPFPWKGRPQNGR